MHQGGRRERVRVNRQFSLGALFLELPVVREFVRSGALLVIPPATSNTLVAQLLQQPTPALV